MKKQNDNRQESEKSHLISEEELLETIKQAGKDYIEGKAIKADSLRAFL